MTDRDPEFEAWINRARDSDIMAVATRCGASLKRFGRDHKGPCPVCSPGEKGSDRFVVTPSNPDPLKRWMCRGARGGDVIAMVEHTQACDFVAAVEFITGEAPPRGGTGRSIDPDAARERRSERVDDRIDAHRDEQILVARKMETARDVFAVGRDIFGTAGDRYFRRRGIALNEELATDFRFIPSLEYRGYPDENGDEQIVLGSFPCIIAAMRDAAGELTAVHRTYLDPREPKKLVPPGDAFRNKAKKAMGRAGGSMIRLGFVSPIIAIGEGIETTLSWRALGGGGDECSFAAAYSLGNIAGSAVAQLPHPTKPGKTIPNGEPDMAQPGLILPDIVREVILLGDGDSDPAATRAALLTGARRFRAQGRVVTISFAPPGGDWNDVLLEREDIAA